MKTKINQEQIKTEEKAYKILWSRDDYGYCIVLAQNAQEARELFESGQFSDEDLVTRDGSIIIDDVVDDNTNN